MQRNPFANSDRQPVEGLPPVRCAIMPRKPTMAMLISAAEVQPSVALSIWTRMFDAALGGGSEGLPD